MAPVLLIHFRPDIWTLVQGLDSLRVETFHSPRQIRGRKWNEGRSKTQYHGSSKHLYFLVDSITITLDSNSKHRIANLHYLLEPLGLS